jgi:hypothetical protein
MSLGGMSLGGSRLLSAAGPSLKLLYLVLR